VKRRVAAALLALVAAGLHVGVTRPAGRQRDEARDAFARGREERERLRAESLRLERRSATGKAPAGEAAAARALRLSLLRATEGLALESVRIGSEPRGGAGIAARGRLVAQGRQADVLRAAGRLADASSGVLLERVTLVQARAGAVRLEAEAFSVRGES
jgi:hypothetical protein